MQDHKILVTGFRPFLGESVNPSQILIEWLQSSPDFSGSVETLLLPVSFKNAAPLLFDFLKNNEYDFILMLGQAGGRNKVNLERVALNWIESDHPDEDGYRPPQGPIAPQSEPALFTDSAVTHWQKALEEMELPVSISLSAGGYVCNYLYYQVLSEIKKQGKRTQSCFIHVPYLPEQCANKQEMPSMSLEVMQKILRQIILLCK